MPAARKPSASRRNTRKTAPRPRLARTLFATALLVVFGFGFGLVAGALWETPSTLLGPFRGETHVLDLTVLEDPTGSAEPLEGEGDAPVERVIAEVPEPPPVAAAPPPSSGPFAVQVGSYEEPVPAWKLAEQLGAKDYAVYVDEGSAAGKPRWRVRVGPIPDRDQAERVARRLKNQERLPIWVIATEQRP